MGIIIYIYIFPCSVSSVSPLLSFLFLIFALVHFIIFVETKGENTFRQGGNILKAIFVPSRSEEKSLEIKKQISWKLLATWDRGGGGEKKIESGQRSRSSISSKILFDRCRSSKNRTTVNGKSFFPIYFPSGNGRRTIQFFDSSSL